MTLMKIQIMNKKICEVADSKLLPEVIYHQI
jgi:hypothetical protein